MVTAPIVKKQRLQGTYTQKSIAPASSDPAPAEFLGGWELRRALWDLGQAPCPNYQTSSYPASTEFLGE